MLVAEKRFCVICGAEFFTKNPSKKTCSKECSKTLQKISHIAWNKKERARQMAVDASRQAKEF